MSVTKKAVKKAPVKKTVSKKAPAMKDEIITVYSALGVDKVPKSKIARSMKDNISKEFTVHKGKWRAGKPTEAIIEEWKQEKVEGYYKWLREKSIGHFNVDGSLDNSTTSKDLCETLNKIHEKDLKTEKESLHVAIRNDKIKTLYITLEKLRDPDGRIDTKAAAQIVKMQLGSIDLPVDQLPPMNIYMEKSTTVPIFPLTFLTRLRRDGWLSDSQCDGILKKLGTTLKSPILNRGSIYTAVSAVSGATQQDLAFVEDIMSFEDVLRAGYETLTHNLMLRVDEWDRRRAEKLSVSHSTELCPKPKTKEDYFAELDALYENDKEALVKYARFKQASLKHGHPTGSFTVNMGSQSKREDPFEDSIYKEKQESIYRDAKRHKIIRDIVNREEKKLMLCDCNWKTRESKIVKKVQESFPDFTKEEYYKLYSGLSVELRKEMLNESLKDRGSKKEENLPPLPAPEHQLLIGEFNLMEVLNALCKDTNFTFRDLLDLRVDVRESGLFYKDLSDASLYPNNPYVRLCEFDRLKMDPSTLARMLDGLQATERGRQCKGGMQSKPLVQGMSDEEACAYKEVLK